MLRLFAKSTLPAVKPIATHIAKPSPTPLFRTFATNMSRSEEPGFEASKLFDVSHVTALVTGGATGIGLMITQALVSNGAKVYITGRREEVLSKTVEMYNTGPGKLMSLTGDVGSKEGCLKLAREMKEKEPKGIQLLVNNAGVARDVGTMFGKNGQPDMNDAEAISKHFLASEDQQWIDTFATNVSGQYFMSMAFLPLLAAGNKITPGYSSSVVNVSSISGAMKGSSNGQFSYASSKAASTHLSRMLATTFKDVKVRVNVIAPGVFPSEMTAGKSGEDNKSEGEMDLRSSNPAGRKGEQSDMAATILFLAGKGGVFYNEQILYPDGGNTLAVPAVN